MTTAGSSCSISNRAEHLSDTVHSLPGIFCFRADYLLQSRD